MHCFPVWARLPEDRPLLARISAAASRLSVSLAGMNVNALPISEYNKRYFGEYTLKSLQSALQNASYLLAWALAGKARPLGELTLVDYGGGPGTLSLLAKQAGVGTVVYCDIYDVSCRDARVIGSAISTGADHYVTGEAAELVEYLACRKMTCDALASFDVLEHIYDLPRHFAELAKLSGGEFTLVMASTANASNPLIRRDRVRMHRSVEYRDQERAWGWKERDESRAYLSVRNEIVQRFAPALSEKETKALAAATRGLIVSDIERSVKAYQETGTMPRPPRHPTNTCDPYTGNWKERLLDLNELRDMLRSTGFRAVIKNGYYAAPRSVLKRFAGWSLNRLISLSGSQGLRLAPYYMVYATRAQEDRGPLE